MLKICLVCRNKVAMVFFLYMLHCISSLMWLMKKLFSLLSFNAHLCHLDKRIDLFCHHYVMQILASKINPQGRHSFCSIMYIYNQQLLLLSFLPPFWIRFAAPPNFLFIQNLNFLFNRTALTRSASWVLGLGCLFRLAL